MCVCVHLDSACTCLWLGTKLKSVDSSVRRRWQTETLFQAKLMDLGGVHSMACDFETNIFASLSFVVSRGVNTLRECYSQLM